MSRGETVLSLQSWLGGSWNPPHLIFLVLEEQLQCCNGDLVTVRDHSNPPATPVGRTQLCNFSVSSKSSLSPQSSCVRSTAVFSDLRSIRKIHLNWWRRSCYTHRSENFIIQYLPFSVLNINRNSWKIFARLIRYVRAKSDSSCVMLQHV